MLSSRNRRPWKYQPAQLVPVRPWAERRGPATTSAVQIAGSSDLIEAPQQLAGREYVLVLSGRSRPNPGVTPTAARTE